MLLVFPCYQTFAAVLDSPGSVPATISSLILLPNCPHYQFFSAISLPLLPDFRCYLRHDSPRSDPVPKSSLSLLLNCSHYQFSTATSLPLLPDFRCCPGQLPSQKVLNQNLGDAQHPPICFTETWVDTPRFSDLLPWRGHWKTAGHAPYVIGWAGRRLFW